MPNKCVQQGAFATKGVVRENGVRVMAGILAGLFVFSFFLPIRAYALVSADESTSELPPLSESVSNLEGVNEAVARLKADKEAEQNGSLSLGVPLVTGGRVSFPQAVVAVYKEAGAYSMTMRVLLDGEVYRTMTFFSGEADGEEDWDDILPDDGEVLYYRTVTFSSGNADPQDALREISIPISQTGDHTISVEISYDYSSTVYCPYYLCEDRYTAMFAEAMATINKTHLAAINSQQDQDVAACFADMVGGPVMFGLVYTDGKPGYAEDISEPNTPVNYLNFRPGEEPDKDQTSLLGVYVDIDHFWSVTDAEDGLIMPSLRRSDVQYYDVTMQDAMSDTVDILNVPVATATSEIGEPPMITPIPTIKPTATPTVKPTVTPTIAPTVAPTIAPTVAPTAAPTIAPTAAPTIAPTVAPTATTTAAPPDDSTPPPVSEPTSEIIIIPPVTMNPDPTPTDTIIDPPVVQPTYSPEVIPTIKPTDVPTAAPTVKPTAAPTVKPTATPTVIPTATPTAKPTATPTLKPTVAPTAKPTVPVYNGTVTAGSVLELTATPEPTATPSPTPTVTPKPTATPKSTMEGLAPTKTYSVVLQDTTPERNVTAAANAAALVSGGASEEAVTEGTATDDTVSISNDKTEANATNGVSSIELGDSDKKGRSWSIIALIATAATICGSVWMIIRRKGRKDDKDIIRYRRVFIIISVVLAVLAAIVFLLTQDWRTPMALLNPWALISLGILLLQAANGLLGKKEEETESKEKC